MVTGFMMYALWLVLIVIGLNVLVGAIRAVVRDQFDTDVFPRYLTTAILGGVLPLLVLAHLRYIDPSGWLILLFYYVSAIGLFVKYLLDLLRKIKR
ncbi:MAG: hypothetical protein OWT28_05635 [Firmicutes bacterium]|nr:hypothetical protein [Bacillota bacterium]